MVVVEEPSELVADWLVVPSADAPESNACRGSLPFEPELPELA